MYEAIFCLVTLIYAVKLYSEGRVFDPDVDKCRSELMTKIPFLNTLRNIALSALVMIDNLFTSKIPLKMPIVNSP
jgi:hypothetical protein